MTAFDPAVLPYEERLHWQSRKDWPAGFSEHTALGVMVFLWIFTVGWWGFTGFIATVNHDKIVAALQSGISQWFLPVLILLIGLGTLIGAIRTTIIWLRDGTTTLRFDTVPAFTGGTFRGQFHGGGNLVGRRPFKLSLVCEDITQTQTRDKPGSRAKHRHFVRRELGAVKGKIDQAPQPAPGGGCRLDIEVAIPADLPGSFHRENGTGVQWTLSIMTDDGQSPVFSAAFEIPVYRHDELQAA